MCGGKKKKNCNSLRPAPHRKERLMGLCALLLIRERGEPGHSECLFLHYCVREGGRGGSMKTEKSLETKKNLMLL